MKRKAIVYLASSVLLLFGMLGALWAYCATYNRPNPLMDYVSQDQGIYDTMYENFTASDCRGCHGDLTGDLHRLTGPGLNGECSAPQCHPGGPPAPGTQLSCVDPSCHVYPNKVHHRSDLAASAQCTACHRPDMVARLRGVGPLVYYPSDPAPTPFRCENCHWEATIGLDPEVNSLYHLHHMDDDSHVFVRCYDCHSLAYNDPDWDSDEPTLIRFCENCHTKDTLHAVHAEDSYGWEAVGFHVPEDNYDCADVEPDTYRLFTSEEKCVACHGELPAGSPIPGPQLPAVDSVDPHSGSDVTIMILGSNFGSSGPEAWLVFTPRVGDTSNPVIIPSTDSSVFGWYGDHILVHTPDASPGGNYDLQVRTATGLSNRALFTLTGTGTPPPVPGTPAITAISPTVGTDDTLVTLEGSNFGDRHCCDREVYFKLVGSPNDPAAMPVYSWTDTKVIVRLLPWNPPMATPGIYSVAVYNESGYSNVVTFTYRESLGGAELTRDDLALTITGSDSFGDLQSEVFGDNYGYSSQVKIGDRDHTYTATHITSWTATQIDLILDSFVDENGSPVSELYGEFGLLVETTYFYDTTLNGQLDPGDQVYHTVTSSLKQLLIPICECDLVPDATFVPRGGTLGFDITVTNNTDQVQVFGFATYATKPNGGKYPPSGYLIGPARVSLNPYGSRSAHRSHPIPGNVPLGTYTYYGVVGTPGAGLYHKCQFAFEVTVP